MLLHFLGSQRASASTKALFSGYHRIAEAFMFISVFVPPCVASVSPEICYVSAAEVNSCVNQVGPGRCQLARRRDFTVGSSVIYLQETAKKACVQ